MRWLYPEVDEAKARELSYRCKFSPLFSKLLLRIGLTSEKEVAQFISPSLKNLLDPYILNGTRSAAQRIIKAVKDKEKIAVYGDYDVDGITATALLIRLLNQAGGNCFFFIPNRFDEGYGINEAAAKEIVSKGARLVISVDCGIKAFGPDEIFASSGVDFILTDHHEPSDSIPRCFSVINPKLQADLQDTRNLAGVGVAFKLAHAIVKYAKETGEKSFNDVDLREFLDLVALGTVADIVPLTGENRILTFHGLKKLENSSNRGIISLIDILGLKKPFKSYDISFRIGPVLNAAGRIEDANKCVELLVSDDKKQAVEISGILQQHNICRRGVEKSIVDEAMRLVNELKERGLLGKAIVLKNEKWSTGVIGIAASKISKLFHRPAIMFGREKDLWKGSARSIEGFNLIEAMRLFEDYFESYGGHEMAAGLSVSKNNYKRFKENFEDYADKKIPEESLIPCMNVSAVAEHGEINEDFAGELKSMEPFGSKNPEPLIVVKNVKLAADAGVVAGEHLKFRVSLNGRMFDCIAFGKAREFSGLKKGSLLNLAIRIREDNYLNRHRIQFVVQDIKN
ncbi:MAG: single-stranded-DNA-specific exonuclease RecJ [Candidatus Aureabacteria bacterium]|nr:single-stranded-DNA-specific exonuclease RecJ [Candidatus Auribacterota bacterium]